MNYSPKKQNLQLKQKQKDLLIESDGFKFVTSVGFRVLIRTSTDDERIYSTF